MRTFVLLCASLAECLLAQDVTFQSDVRLVEMYATVFDKAGHPINGLSRDQFEILDEGAPQTISVFEKTEKPLACALVLDTTGSMTAALPALRNAARMFIDVLRPGDSVAVYSFTEQLVQLSEMTTDRAAAHRALARLRAGGRTALFDAVSQVALKMEKVAGKKVIVVLTDGGDNASVLNRQAAGQRARKAGVPVFAVAEGDALHDAVAQKLLSELSRDTGGHMYRAGESKDIEKIFSNIAADLQNGYLLAFQPAVTPDNPASGWRRLQIVVKNTNTDLTVRTRSGYSVE